MNLISDSTENIIMLLEKSDYQIILMDPDSENLINDFKANNNFAVIIGSEQYGISEKWFKSKCTKLKINSLNDVGAGFGGNTNKVTLIDKNLVQTVYPLKSKANVAADIMTEIQKQINA